MGGAWSGWKGVAPPLRKKTVAWQENRRKRDGRRPKHVLSAFGQSGRRGGVIIMGGNRSQTSQTFTVRTGERGGAGGGACPGETALRWMLRTRGFICGDKVNRTLVSFSQ